MNPADMTPEQKADCLKWDRESIELLENKYEKAGKERPSDEEAKLALRNYAEFIHIFIAIDDRQKKKVAEPAEQHSEFNKLSKTIEKSNEYISERGLGKSSEKGSSPVYSEAQIRYFQHD